ncbi:MAG: hypothetical protein ABEK12_02450 [Candidatus Nanohaloarchaea archaeon]
MGDRSDIRRQLDERRTVRDIAEALGLPLQQVIDVACSTERLKHLYHEQELTQGEIAERLGLSQACISRRMDEDGIDTGHVPWTDEDEQLLADRYGDADREELASIFPGRTWNAIKLKAMKLDVSMSARQLQNSDEVARHLRSLARDSVLEIDHSKHKQLSYILGVVDGDGFHNDTDTVGLEVNSATFADKFADALGDIGLNPGRGCREERGRETVWAGSIRLVEWLEDFTPASKRDWLLQHGTGWNYVEGLYESDGNLTGNGTARICSYDADAREFIATLLRELGITCSIQQNNVYVFKTEAETFYGNIDPVHRTPS